jgi:hypothetical protein
MAQKPPDKVQREIEELLDTLDNFVPEERLAQKIRGRYRRQQVERTTGPFKRIANRFSRVTAGQLMLAGIALLLIAYLMRNAIGDFFVLAVVVGLVALVAGFLLSLIFGSSRRTVTGGNTYEKRWRGQVIEYEEPPANRLRNWFKGRRDK